MRGEICNFSFTYVDLNCLFPRIFNYQNLILHSKKFHLSKLIIYNTYLKKKKNKWTVQPAAQCCDERNSTENRKFPQKVDIIMKFLKCYFSKFPHSNISRSQCFIVKTLKLYYDCLRSMIKIFVSPMFS